MVKFEWPSSLIDERQDIRPCILSRPCWNQAIRVSVIASLKPKALVIPMNR